MSETFDDTNRQVLPRWYPYPIASYLGDLIPLDVDSQASKRRRNDQSEMDRRERDWSLRANKVSAVDFVGGALVAQDYTRAHDAAEFLLNCKEVSVEPVVVRMAELYLAYARGVSAHVPILSPSPHRAIAHLKRSVRAYGRDAIAWSDLAFYYAVLGQVDKARQAMGSSLGLASQNRFILRSAARCFLHLGDPDRALAVLRSSESLRKDPLLLSAEIAVADAVEEDSHVIKVGRRILESGRLPLRAVSELAAALGTIEAKAGAVRKSKKLIGLSLAMPSENAVAQAEWLRKVHRVYVQIPNELSLAHEARARRCFDEGEYEGALEEARRWFRFQPFASRPAILASFIASTIMQDDELALEILRAARVTSPGSFLVRNNYAYSLASLNRLEEASLEVGVLGKLAATRKDELTLAATCGLLEFRLGNVAAARQSYRRATEGLEKLQDFRSLAVAMAFWAREESRVDHLAYLVLRSRAAALIDRFGVHEMSRFVDNLR